MADGNSIPNLDGQVHGSVVGTAMEGLSFHEGLGIITFFLFLSFFQLELSLDLGSLLANLMT